MFCCCAGGVAVDVVGGRARAGVAGFAGRRSVEMECYGEVGEGWDVHVDGIGDEFGARRDDCVKFAGEGERPVSCSVNRGRGCRKRACDVDGGEAERFRAERIRQVNTQWGAAH